jgi:hypothetical protein
VCGEIESGISDALSLDILSEKNFRKLSGSRDKELEGNEGDALVRFRRESKDDRSFRGLEAELDIRLLK